MGNLKLTKSEIAALDLLIATIEEGEKNEVQFGDAGNLTLITAVTKATRVVTKATRYVPVVVDLTTNLIGGTIREDEGATKLLDKNGQLDLNALKEIRKQLS